MAAFEKRAGMFRNRQFAWPVPKETCLDLIVPLPFAKERERCFDERGITDSSGLVISFAKPLETLFSITPWRNPRGNCGN